MHKLSVRYAIILFAKLTLKSYKYEKSKCMIETDYNKGNTIKASQKWVMVCFILALVLFVFCILGSNKFVKEHYVTVSYTQPLDTVFVENPHSYRGGTEYIDSHFIPASSVLVDNKDGWNGWNFYSKEDINYHNISHVDGPYYMYKAANNDTIIVIKDGYVLKFKMPQSDTVSRRERLWRD